MGQKCLKKCNHGYKNVACLYLSIGADTCGDREGNTNFHIHEFYEKHIFSVSF